MRRWPREGGGGPQGLPPRFSELLLTSPQSPEFTPEDAGAGQRLTTEGSSRDAPKVGGMKRAPPLLLGSPLSPKGASAFLQCTCQMVRITMPLSLKEPGSPTKAPGGEAGAGGPRPVLEGPQRRGWQREEGPRRQSWDRAPAPGSSSQETRVRALSSLTAEGEEFGIRDLATDSPSRPSLSSQLVTC